MYRFAQNLDVRGKLGDIETDNEVETGGPFLCREFRLASSTLLGRKGDIYRARTTEVLPQCLGCTLKFVIGVYRRKTLIEQLHRLHKVLKARDEQA